MWGLQPLVTAGTIARPAALEKPNAATSKLQTAQGAARTIKRARQCTTSFENLPACHANIN